MRARLAVTLGWLGGVGLVAFVVLPLWYMVILSLDPDPVGHAGTLWPQGLSLDNYRFLTSTGLPVLPRPVAQPAAVVRDHVREPALSRSPAPTRWDGSRCRGQAQILAGMITLAFFPGIVLVVPLSKVFSDIGWLDRLYGIGLAQLSFTLPLALWFLAYAFRAVPARSRRPR